jgi:hypothetical protein
MPASAVTGAGNAVGTLGYGSPTSKTCRRETASFLVGAVF